MCQRTLAVLQPRLFGTAVRATPAETPRLPRVRLQLTGSVLTVPKSVIAGRRLVHSPSASPRQLEIMALHPEAAVRRALAQRPDCPPKALQVLADDEDPQVALQAIGHPQCPHGYRLANLLRLASSNIRSWAAVAKHPSCPLDLLLRLAQDPAPRVRHSASQNPSLPEEYRVLAQVAR